MRSYIIAGWPCVGKSYLAANQRFVTTVNDFHTRMIIDYDSAVFKSTVILPEGSTWQQAYVKMIDDDIDQFRHEYGSGSAFMLVCNHSAVVDELATRHKVIIVRPVWHSKHKYLDALKDRVPIINDKMDTESPQYRAYIAMEQNFDSFYRGATMFAADNPNVTIYNVDFRQEKCHLFDVLGSLQLKQYNQYN